MTDVATTRVPFACHAKVARCAAARKLLHLAWALGSKQQRFDPGFKQQQHEASPEPPEPPELAA